MEYTEKTIEKLEQLIAKYQSELAEKNIEMQKVKSSFMANFTHEIRTPMNVIVGFANLLTDPGYNNNQKKYFVEEINKNSKQLLQMIDRVLYVSKIESENISLNSEEIHVHWLVSELKKEIKSSFAGKKLRSSLKFKTLSTAGIQDIKINTDFEKLKSALIILLEDISRKPGREPIIDINADDEVLVFSIQTQMKPSVGSTNGKLDQYVEQQGIDLVLADRLISLLGGTLTVRSNLEKESSLYFTIPLLVEKPVHQTG